MSKLVFKDGSGNNIVPVTEITGSGSVKITRTTNSISGLESSKVDISLDGGHTLPIAGTANQVKLTDIVVNNENIKKIGFDDKVQLNDGQITFGGVVASGDISTLSNNTLFIVDE